MVDLARFATADAADEGRWMVVLNPLTAGVLEQDGAPIRVRVRGADSIAFERARENLVRAVFQRGVELTDAERAAMQARALAAIVVDWEGIVWDGKPLACTPENVEMILLKAPWLRRQIDDFAATRANFLPPSSEG